MSKGHLGERRARASVSFASGRPAALDVAPRACAAPRRISRRRRQPRSVVRAERI